MVHGSGQSVANASDVHEHNPSSRAYLAAAEQIREDRVLCSSSPLFISLSQTILLRQGTIVLLRTRPPLSILRGSPTGSRRMSREAETVSLFKYASVGNSSEAFGVTEFNPLKLTRSHFSFRSLDFWSHYTSSAPMWKWPEQQGEYKKELLCNITQLHCRTLWKQIMHSTKNGK